MKCKNILRFCLMCGFFVLLLCKPRLTGELTFARLSFFVHTVFPSLFVSLCLSGMLVTSPAVHALYRFPFGVECTVLALGVLCGFPVGARCALLLYRGGVITKQRAEFLCGCTNVASLPFLIGVVGSAMANDTAFGIRLAASQAVCAVLSGVCLFFVFRPSCRGVQMRDAQETIPTVSASVAKGAHTMLEIGGMLIFFGVAADVLNHIFGLTGVGAVLLSGLLEFSSGCAGALAYGGTVGTLIAVLAVGFSGLCVLSQVASVTEGELSMRPYLLGKLVQTALMGAFAVLTNA